VRLYRPVGLHASILHARAGSTLAIAPAASDNRRPMRTRTELALALMGQARGTLDRNIEHLTLEEALQTAGGYRSVLGILKHTASWTHVYHSYAFEPAPRHLNKIDWPLGLRDTVETTQPYLDEMRSWLRAGFDAWESSLATVADSALDAQHRCHWGATAPLFDIVVMVAMHWSYHAGELNEILAVLRGEAWEYSEEVEENHISTAGHRLRPDWMNPAQAQQYEAHLARRDAELHGRP
jgi:hypothetical protein